MVFCSVQALASQQTFRSQRRHAARQRQEVTIAKLQDEVKLLQTQLNEWWTWWEWYATDTVAPLDLDLLANLSTFDVACDVASPFPDNAVPVVDSTVRGCPAENANIMSDADAVCIIQRWWRMVPPPQLVSYRIPVPKLVLQPALGQDHAQSVISPQADNAATTITDLAARFHILLPVSSQRNLVYLVLRSATNCKLRMLVHRRLSNNLITSTSKRT